jgi:hypothetical protein
MGGTPPITTVGGLQCSSFDDAGSHPYYQLPVSISSGEFTVSYNLYYPGVGMFIETMALFNSSGLVRGIGIYPSGSLYLYLEPGSLLSVSNDVDFPTNTWMTLTIVLSDGSMKFYVNGIYKNSIGDGSDGSLTSILIGAYPESNALRSGVTFYMRQFCLFDEALTAQQVSTLYTMTQGYDIIGPPPSAPTAITGLASSNITSSAFTVSWSGGTGTGVATTYTLNGSAATPSSSAAGTATFSGLTSGTEYTVVITATNSSGSVSGNLVVTTSADGGGTLGPSDPTGPHFTLTFPNTAFSTTIQFGYDPAIGYAGNNLSAIGDYNAIYDPGAFTAKTISPYTDTTIYIEVLSSSIFTDPAVGNYFFRFKMPQWFLDAVVAELQTNPAAADYYNRYTDATTCMFTLVFANDAFQGGAVDGLPENNLGTIGLPCKGTGIGTPASGDGTEGN